MHPAVTLMMASVGASIEGTGRSSSRMSRGPWMVVTRMTRILTDAVLSHI